MRLKITHIWQLCSFKFIIFCLLVVLCFNLFIHMALDRHPQGKDAANQQKHDRSLYDINTEENQNPFYQGMGILFNNTNTKWQKDLVWPDFRAPNEDRILEQISYIPPSKPNSIKTIVVYNGLGATPSGQTHFINEKCHVTSCSLSPDRSKAMEADAILFQQSVAPSGLIRYENQIWIVSFLESPFHSSQMSYFHNMINWTATYRHDSILTTPYGKYVRSENTNDTPLPNYAKSKKKLIAWFVSNCASARMHYANELNKYIPIDMYGSCGKLKCSRKDGKCFEMLKSDYKFYLAFENIKCRDYITEKFFFNALQHDVIPVVYGAHPEDYKRVAPPHSFIHVDDFETPKDLAGYLYKLDNNETLYNEYFKWKSSWKSVDAKFWCRLCALLNYPNPPPLWFPDFDKWWRAPGSCQKYQLQTRWTNSTYKRTWT